ncbi:MAG: hydrogenase [Gemmatimonadetes bacterium GWC2_71_10]|nr:MAG: hydrogenase [Gemmatimonadetes bacterium GWC2_71_10]
MSGLAELLLVLVVLANFVVLGTARLSTCVRSVAMQGILLGLAPVLLFPGWSAHRMVLAAGTIVIKGLIVPRFLLWAIREASVRREVEPRLGYGASLVVGTIALALAFALAERWPLPVEGGGLLVAVAVTTLVHGLFVLTARRKAIMQVVGYIMMENGIYLIGLTQAERVPFLVELGVLLDVFVGIFIMGIVVFHINREFDSIDASRLTELAE